MTGDTSFQTEKAKDAVDGGIHEADRSMHGAIEDVKAGFENMKGALKDNVENLKDAVNEHMHREAASAEQTRREVAGDTMTPSERISSVANEVRNTVQANVDALKQRARTPDDAPHE